MKEENRVNIIKFLNVTLIEFKMQIIFSKRRHQQQIKETVISNHMKHTWKKIRCL